MSAKIIKFDCPHCLTFQTLQLNDGLQEISFSCQHCQKNIEFRHLNQENIDVCPVCDCRELYQHKDFNKKLGLIIFLVGVIFSFWTYHISLIVALIIDALLYPFFPWMAVCYRCHAELRGWPKNSRLDRFSHEVGAHYEYRQNNNKTD